MTGWKHSIIAFLIEAEFPGSSELRVQLDTARVVAECECGCGTIVLFVDPSAPPADTAFRIPVEASAYAGTAGTVDAMLLLDDEHRMVSLEFMWWDTDEFTQLPPLEDWVRSYATAEVPAGRWTPEG